MSLAKSLAREVWLSDPSASGMGEGEPLVPPPALSAGSDVKLRLRPSHPQAPAPRIAKPQPLAAASWGGGERETTPKP